MSTREALEEVADRNGWESVYCADLRVDIYRAQPHSMMLQFTRDGMLVNAQLFVDAPESSRTQLPPREILSLEKMDDNKRRKVSSWFYHYKPVTTA